jgi:hypothetical protein
MSLPSHERRAPNPRRNVQTLEPIEQDYFEDDFAEFCIPTPIAPIIIQTVPDIDSNYLVRRLAIPITPTIRQQLTETDSNYQVTAAMPITPNVRHGHTNLRPIRTAKSGGCPPQGSIMSDS